jgi:ribosomal protein L40E
MIMEHDKFTKARSKIMSELSLTDNQFSQVMQVKGLVAKIYNLLEELENRPIEIKEIYVKRKNSYQPPETKTCKHCGFKGAPKGNFASNGTSKLGYALYKNICRVCFAKGLHKYRN